MLSKITIDLDEDNNPIIVVQHNESTDLRDKVVQKFIEGISGAHFVQCFFEGNALVLRPYKMGEDVVSKIIKSLKTGLEAHTTPEYLAQKRKPLTDAESTKATLELIALHMRGVPSDRGLSSQKVKR